MSLILAMVTAAAVLAASLALLRYMRRPAPGQAPAPAPAPATFAAVRPRHSGLLPSPLDTELERCRPGDTTYFFTFDRDNCFQLTMKMKSRGCFFLVKIKVDSFIFENCGYLEKEPDGSFR